LNRGIIKIYDMNTQTAMDMSPAEFRKAGHLMVDLLAEFLEELPELPVTRGENPAALRVLLPQGGIPGEGQETTSLVRETAKLLTEHSLFNGHPRFWGYITSSAAPLGALADLLAAAVNPNVGAQTLSPMATEIEQQTIRWLSQLIGYSENGGGIFVSGGNMANFLGYLTARKNKVKKEHAGAPVLYCPRATHTWIHKAVTLFGGGMDEIRWIDVLPDSQMDLEDLNGKILSDIQNGTQPFMVIGNAGTVETGCVDNLRGIAEICRRHNLWFHIDGAYGAPAAALPELKSLFSGISEADSVAIDPHKWLYSPLEAGCTLVKDAAHLKDAFSHRPPYYNFEGDPANIPLNYHEYGMQNSRGFRALKVWMSIRHIGRKGIIDMIRKDIALAEDLFRLVSGRDELRAVACHLSITTFQYVPAGLNGRADQESENRLNEELLNRLQKGGEVFLSNAIVQGAYCLRVCIVNFRTTYKDLEFLVEKVIEQGRLLEAEQAVQA